MAKKEPKEKKEKKEKKPVAKEVSITGFVDEIELEDGETGLQIDDGDNVYDIIMDKIGSQLKEYIDEEVDITGLMTKTKGKLELKVNQFQPTDDYDDEDDDDDRDYYHDEDD